MAHAVLGVCKCIKLDLVRAGYCGMSMAPVVTKPRRSADGLVVDFFFFAVHVPSGLGFFIGFGLFLWSTWCVLYVSFSLRTYMERLYAALAGTCGDTDVCTFVSMCDRL